MSDPTIDSGKRTWIIASGCAGVVGAGFAAVPFVSSFQPSERARAAGAPVEVDIGALKAGEKLTVEWRGQPVWIIRRTPEQVAELPKLDPMLADPASKRNQDELTPTYARNEARSIKPEVLVVVGICTHLGCSPSDKFTPGAQPSLRTTGSAASCALATARPSTWPAGSTRTSPLPTTCESRRICTWLTTGWSLAKRRRRDAPATAVSGEQLNG
jgi:ubiquinol-cytochrome c reductase iron-sulfur subunit